MKTKIRRAPKKSLRQNLDAQLAQLESAQLVHAETEGERTYAFKHPLTQEAAYESLLLKQRREIHRRVGETYEHLHPDRLDEFAAMLARHYAEAGDDAKTLEYSIRAGDVASRVHANDEAVAHYARALSTAARGVEVVAHTLHDLMPDCAYLGDSEDARAEARHVIAYIVEHAPSNLCDAFLNLPSVRAVVGER